jgi:hypothetical protein
MTYVLILFAHVGLMGSGNSNSITTANFSNKGKCERALAEAKGLSGGSTKTITGVCVEK